jgi:hypothetical protein
LALVHKAHLHPVGKAEELTPTSPPAPYLRTGVTYESLPASLEWSYARSLLIMVVLVTGSDAGSTTAASPSALESVTGSRLMVTARFGGITVVCSSTITSRFCGERLLRELAFFVFLLFVFLLAIQTSESEFISRTDGSRSIVIRTLQCDRVACLLDVLHAFRAVCGTCYVNDATAVRAYEILQWYKTRPDIVAVRIRSFY